MTEPWQLFLLWGVVNGTATGAISVPLAAIIVTGGSWPGGASLPGSSRRATLPGQLVFLPLLAWVAGFDWRYAALLVAVAALGLVLPLVVALMRDRPGEVGTRPYGADPGWQEPAAAPAAFGAALAGLRARLGSRTFWVLAGTFFVCGATTNGLVSTHLIPAAHDHGIAQVSAASLLALIGVFDIVGTVASGWLTDRFDARRLLLVYYGFRGLALLALPVAFDSRSAALVGFAVVYGLDCGDGAAHFGARDSDVPPAGGGRVRVDLQRAPVRRGCGRVGSQASGHRPASTAAWAAAGGLALLAAVAVLLISATPRRPVEAAATA